MTVLCFELRCEVCSPVDSSDERAFYAAVVWPATMVLWGRLDCESVATRLTARWPARVDSMRHVLDPQRLNTSSQN